METVEEAVDYNTMDHSVVNARFVDDLLTAITHAGLRFPLTVFDAGTGTALIPIELLRRGVAVQITAADAAREMLRIAADNVAAGGWSAQITLIERDCKALPEADGSYQVAMSNSLIHHLPEPSGAIAEAWRILQPGGLLFLRDLARPENDVTLEGLVAMYADTATPHQRQLFRQSLHAALTVDEIEELLARLMIPPVQLEMTSDRHWTLAAVKPATASAVTPSRSAT
jgi:ubiquinone/menaquinone biosynthesis C-methylase UbiE